jgi:hypothetical protein
MAGTVLILGAGASVQAGAPVMHNFLDIAESLWRKKGVAEDDLAHIARVFRGVDALQGAYAKATIDSENLESVYSAFELAAVFGQLGALPREDVCLLPRSMRHLIVATLEHMIEFRFDDRHVRPPEPYETFARLIKQISETEEARPVSILTFNYDIAVDYGLFFCGVPHSYCLEHETVPIRLLKLHGSTNWVARRDGRIRAWSLKEYFQRYNWSPRMERGARAYLKLSQQLKELCDSAKDEELVPDAVIVPPTSSKVQHYQQISNVWAAAAAALGQADNIFVCGYSLPETDMFFRYLFALGTISATRLKRFWVYDPDSTGTVESRFRGLLGPTTLRRFRFIPLTFGGNSETYSRPSAIDDIRDTFKIRSDKLIGP